MCIPLRASVRAGAGAGFADLDLREQRQLAVQLVPDPLGDHFRSWVFQSFDLIEATVIQRLFDWSGDLLDFTEVDQVAIFRAHFTLDHDIHSEGVAVHTPALVPLREGGQPVGGFEAETLAQ